MKKNKKLIIGKWEFLDYLSKGTSGMVFQVKPKSSMKLIDSKLKNEFLSISWVAKCILKDKSTSNDVYLEKEYEFYESYFFMNPFISLCIPRPALIYTNDGYMENVGEHKNINALFIQQVGNITLRQWLNNRTQKERSNFLSRCAVPLLEALFSIHQKQYCINDISLNNIMVDYNGTRAWFIDFGGSSSPDEKYTLLTPLFSVQSHAHTSYKNDCIMFGFLMAYVLLNSLPWENECNDLSICDKKKNGWSSFKIFKGYSKSSGMNKKVFNYLTFLHGDKKWKSSEIMHEHLLKALE
jgi:serine/threonine protein kinase